MKREIAILLIAALALCGGVALAEEPPVPEIGEFELFETPVEFAEAPGDGADAETATAAPAVPTPMPTSTPEPTPEPLRLTGVKIGIDPGHQAHGNSEKETIAPNSSKTKAKVTGGTSGVATGVPEYVTVLEIAFKLRDELESLGAEVYMTRETHDVNISNQERAKMMNELGVDLVLRIHCDGAENRSANGVALYCTATGPVAQESGRAAECILPQVAAATGAKARGVTRNDNYTGQNWSTVPVVMVECGFMSNPDEDVKLNDPAYQQLLAEGMTEGICDFMGR